MNEINNENAKPDILGIRQLFDLKSHYDITFEYLKILSIYITLYQIEKLLKSIEDVAGETRKLAIESLPDAVRALAKVNPDATKTTDLLTWIAKTTKGDVAEALKELSKPETAKALQDLIF